MKRGNKLNGRAFYLKMLAAKQAKSTKNMKDKEPHLPKEMKESTKVEKKRIEVTKDTPKPVEDINPINSAIERIRKQAGI